MSDPESTEKALGKREEETSPFPLERGRSEPPPRPESETTGERTGPFLLERGKSSPDNPIVEPRPPERALTPSARRARRRIAITLFVHAFVLAALSTLAVVRWSKGLGTPPELALAVLSGGVSLVHFRAAFRFSRLGRGASRDGHRLVGALSDLRTVIVLKAVALFLALTLLCFSLSMVISLVASI
jgi:hypothetical protein